MLHHIQNQELSCSIESTGAEVRSLRDKQSGKEHIWQINPNIWGSSSPVLFPAIGKIKEDQITLDGKPYAMTRHGIIRHNESLHFVQESESACSFTLTSSAETLSKYPYAFSFTVRYALEGKRLVMSYSIENRDQQVMYFACGGHTAYACPLNASTSLSDYVVEFPSPSPLQAETLSTSGLLSHSKRSIALQESIFPLSESLFNEDALIFADIDFDWLRLRKRNEAKGVKLRFSGFPNLALWSKPGADFLCIEPWLGLPDRVDESLDIREKSSYASLAPGEQCSLSIETVVEI